LYKGKPIFAMQWSQPACIAQCGIRELGFTKRLHTAHRRVAEQELLIFIRQT